MEDVGTSVDMDKKYSRPVNPFVAAFNIFKAFIKFLGTVCKQSAKLNRQLRYRIGKTHDWIQKHGIGELFGGEGVWMYTWSDKKQSIDFDGMSYYANSLWQLSQLCAKQSGSQNQEMASNANHEAPFKVVNNAYNRRFSKPEEIIKTVIESTVFNKTKIVVNDNTKERIEELFFGGVPENQDVNINSNEQHAPTEYQNACVAFSYMVARMEVYAGYNEKILEAFNKMEGEPNGIYHNNNKLYMQLGKYFQTAARAYTKYAKVMTHDLNVCANLASGQVPNTKDQNPNLEENQPKDQNNNQL